MAKTRKKPCSICRRWFLPDVRVGARQRACDNPACKAARHKRAQAKWRAANPEYAATRRLDERAGQKHPPDQRLPPLLDKLPWSVAKDVFGAKGADFIGLACKVILRAAEDEILAHAVDCKAVPGTLPPDTRKTRSGLPHTGRQGHATGVPPTRPAV